MQTNRAIHIPVLLREAVDALLVKRKFEPRVLVDATFGLGGYTQYALSKTTSTIVYAFDMDNSKEVLEQVNFLTSTFSPQRFHFINENFCHLQRELIARNVPEIDGIMLDLGVSSLQLDSAHRGFSFREDYNGPLDMRMNNNQSDVCDITAADICNQAPEFEITRILREYGDEPMAAQIARKIVEARQVRLFKTTYDLVQVVESAYSKKQIFQAQKNVCTRTFQALRIHVNRELDNLTAVLNQAHDLMAKGGRVSVVSYHSGEDKIVKNHGKFQAKSKLITPTKQEIEENPRSRSAKLRVLEKM